jgi:hypothetical protein
LISADNCTVADEDDPLGLIEVSPLGFLMEQDSDLTTPLIGADIAGGVRVTQGVTFCIVLGKHWRNGAFRPSGLERTLSAPECILPDSSDATMERYFRPIPEFGGRILRVA